MNNSRIRISMIEHNLKQFELARIMGLHEQSLSRLLRDELPAAKQDEIIELIRQHSKTAGSEKRDGQ